MFGFQVPRQCPGVPESVLYPAEAWADQEEYWKRYRDLAARFVNNFQKYAADCPPDVRAAGPDPERVPVGVHRMAGDGKWAE